MGMNKADPPEKRAQVDTLVNWSSTAIFCLQLSMWVGCFACVFLLQSELFCWTFEWTRRYWALGARVRWFIAA